MILVDTSVLVAIFDPRDAEHDRCRRMLERLDEELMTTVPVLTEAAHMLGTGGRSFAALVKFVRGAGISIFFLTELSLHRVFDLLDLDRDHAMDFADASLVSAAEALGTVRIFTLDRKDFRVLRAKRGHRLLPFEIVP